MSVTREEFRAKAKDKVVTIDGATMVAEPKEFKTGSLGWYAGGKIVVEVDGKPVKVQVGLNLTIVGSKEAVQA